MSAIFLVAGSECKIIPVIVLNLEGSDPIPVVSPIGTPRSHSSTRNETSGTILSTDAMILFGARVI